MHQVSRGTNCPLPCGFDKKPPPERLPISTPWPDEVQVTSRQGVRTEDSKPQVEKTQSPKHHHKEGLFQKNDCSVV